MDYKKLYAIKKKNEQRIKKVCPNISDNSGIYFLTRVDENGFKYAYIGQAKHILERMISHLSGYQHIDLSIKKHGLYDDTNVYGWKLGFLNFPESKLDEMEQHYIKKYADSGYQLRNKTSGSQSAGKSQIDDYRPAKGYRDGIAQGMKNASRDISHLFDKHLDVKTKNDPPTVNQQKAMQKFNDFLNLSKGE